MLQAASLSMVSLPPLAVSAKSKKPIHKVDISLYVSLACWVVLKYFNFPKSVAIEDTEEYGEMMVVLSKCAIEYEEKDGAFSTFSRRAMENRMVDIIRARSRRKDFNLTQLNGHDVLDKSEPDFNSELVDFLLATNDDDLPYQIRYKSALRWHYLDGENLEQIGSRLGISRQAVWQIIEKAKMFMSEKFVGMKSEIF